MLEKMVFDLRNELEGIRLDQKGQPGKFEVNAIKQTAKDKGMQR